MGKTRNTGKLATQIQFDNSNNLVIGNSTSSSFNTSGSVNATGGITGSIYGIGNPTSFSSSISSDLVNLESKSASVDTSISSINSFTASNGNTSLNAATSSYSKLTGGNTFTGTQIVSASVYIQGDLVVQGSSSIQYISASSVSIGTNIVQLNTATPAVRFGGLSVQDSGSSAGVTGSMLWDSCCNRWIYSNPSGVGYSGGVLMSGPRASTFGNEPTLTCNYIAKSGGGDHLYDSCIIDDGTTVCVNATLKASGQVCSLMGNFGCIGIGTTSPTFNLHVTTNSTSIPRGVVFEQTSADTNAFLMTMRKSRSGATAVNGDNIGNWYADAYDGTQYTSGGRIRFSIDGTVSNGVVPTSFQIFTGTGNTGGCERVRITSTGIACFVCQICAPSFIGGTMSGTTIYGSTTVCSPIGLFSGCVGIGTTNPGAQLEVVSTTGGTLRLKRDDTSVTTDEVIGTVEFYTNDGDGPHVTSYIKGLGADFGGSNYGRYGAMSFGVSKTANTDAVEAMRIDLQGAVGIGITSPKSILDVAATSVGDNVASTLTLSAITNAAYGQCAIIQAFVNDSGNAECANIGSIQFIKQRPAGNSIGGDMIFSTRTPAASGMCSPTERMRITNCGKIGIGATDPKWLLEVCCNTTSTGGGGYPAIAINNPNDVGYSALYFFKGANNFGGLEFSNTTCHLFVNTICTFAIQTNNIERLRVNNNGYVSIGANTPIAPLAVYVCGPTTSTPTVQFVSYCGSGSQVYTTIGGSDSWHGMALRGVPNCSSDWSITAGNQISFFEYGGDFRFYQKQPSSLAMQVQFYGGTIYALSTSIVSLSDCRLKENIREIGYGLNEIIQLKPKMFDWKEGHGTCVKDNLGFMAQDVETLLPELVTEWSHTEGVEAYKTLKMGDMIPVLTKAIQEQQCIICSQSQKIALLESCIGIV